MSTLFYGALISPTSLTAYSAHPRALLAVSRATGDIEWVEDDVPAGALQDVLARRGVRPETADVVQLKEGEFLMPGFIDTHIHAPQVPNLGSGQEHELLDWLAEVTFPMEARFADADFARRAYTSVVRRTIDYGSTTCCYYGTLHLDATKVLADVVHSYGQRALIGKCNMDQNSPDYYIEPSPSSSLADTRALIAHIRSLPVHTGGALVQPVLTPRFAIACSHALLAGLGALADADPALAIQTHISENEAEIAFTKSLFRPASLPVRARNFPNANGNGNANGHANGYANGHEHTNTNGYMNGHANTNAHERELDAHAHDASTTYAGVYDAFGLLRANTILAHAVHLEPAELALIQARGAGVSHCPTSNINLRSGCAHVGMLLDRGIKVGLGTDVSGGFSPSMLAAIQHASMCSKVVAMHTPPSHTHTQAAHTQFAGRALPVPTLLHLATLGGAAVCGLGARTGALVPGRAFDALVVSVREDAGNPAVWGVDLEPGLGVSDEFRTGKRTDRAVLDAMLERFLFCGDDRNVRRVYVQGRLVGGKEFRA